MPSIQFSKDQFIAIIKGQKLLFKNNQFNKFIINKEIAAKENVEESSDGFIAYVDDHNLFVTKNSNTKKVTEDGSNDIVYASTVHQSEFGITKGTFWSNNGKLLAFYRMDQSMTPDYPIIDWTERPAKVNYIKYPMAGDSSHHVKLGVYNAETTLTTWIKTTGPKEQYLTNVAWSPDDKYVYIVIVNRDQNHFWVNQYDASSGDFVKTLFEEIVKFRRKLQTQSNINYGKDKYIVSFLYASKKVGEMLR
jgi:dipeptidyl-peptidase-4